MGIMVLEIFDVQFVGGDANVVYLKDHVLFGRTYNTSLITDSALGQSTYLSEAMQLFASGQTGLLSNPGSDFLGESFQIQETRFAYSKPKRSMGKAAPSLSQVL